MKKGRVNATYNVEYVKTNRTFPRKNTVLIILIALLQVGILFLGIRYEPKPQDVIHQYNITVEPLDDGSLDIEYSFVWEALDKSEELTWVEIGMPNQNFSVYTDSVTSNIRTYGRYTNEDYVSLRLDFDKAYIGGDVIEFSFKVNQKNMLCRNEKGYFYEFVPGWFNAVQVKQYEFVWLRDDAEDIVRTGSLDCGEYRQILVQYDEDDFSGCQTVEYYPFDDEGAFNELKNEKAGFLSLCALGVALLIIAEVYIVDSFVSYGRGRGFLNGHGYYVHAYGRTNPHYIRARDRYNSLHNGTHGSRLGGHGGCACACACACAGGGRAGCSQKDTCGKES